MKDAVDISVQCPACGTALSGEPESEGLCPACMLELALEDTSLEAELFDAGEAPTLAAIRQTFTEGQIQGERYRIRSLLGRGGMGEVWRAYDLKLRQDVALKSLRTELIEDAVALEMLRQEVRVAREVISPNVCRVFDLQELDGQELVSMEYIDGTTLHDILRERSPLDLDEAREIASQFLAGLEAIHAAGLVHRDIKPENVMRTRTGRVVVMDLGLAKGLQEGKSGTVSGTPAYMSLEQSRGVGLDARSDIFSAGIVLAEMVAPGGIRSFADRKALWEAIHQAEPEVAETPWARVIRKAVSVEREQRFPSAAALARALEEVTLRASGEKEADPYPGLAAFTQEQAKYFFGRELEVESLWKKLRRPHLLALIAPSGSGKSSFLQAGLLPVLPEDWSAILLTPGNRPFAALVRAVAPVLGGDSEIVEELMRFEEPAAAVSLVSRWRARHRHALILVDQFEELFTQNPPEMQGRFAELLARFPLEADTFVLLSMREDFLYHCQPFEALAPAFSELMPLGSLSGNSLRRALVQPALKCGYRFEDESLVDEMVEEVSHERGALPLLAFAASRLWSMRDRESGLLTRQAYREIGGVGGALAQHAEQTLESIGQDRIPIVRELLRNLVTAQGTRAARDRDELLSVFAENGGHTPFLVGEGRSDGRTEKKVRVPLSSTGERGVAARILDALIDARLLTTYEVPEDDAGSPTQKIEIIHESLLTAWPRLVRWQMQDAEGAKLRDELRHQAEVWKERERPDDLLWTGTSYKEFELWRERYPGGLTAAEEEFARAMTSKAERRKRQRRAVLTAAFVVLIVVVGVMATLWWRGELARREAVAEARRAEASKLLALGRLEVDSNPTAALAYAIASLELSDQATTRRFVLETLWRGPTAFVLNDQWNWNAVFSPDGQRLALGGNNEHLQIWSSHGGEPLALEGRRSVPVGFSPDSELLITQQKRFENSFRTWSVADGRLLRTQILDEVANWAAYMSPDGEYVVSLEVPPGWERVVWNGWPLMEGERRQLGVEELSFAWKVECRDPSSQWLGYGLEHDLYAHQLREYSHNKAKHIGRHEARLSGCAIDANRQRLVSMDEGGEIRIWSLTEKSGEPLRSLQVGEAVGSRAMAFTPDGRYLAAGTSDQMTRIWDLEGPPDAEPVLLTRGSANFIFRLQVHREGRWLASAESEGAALWPLARQYSKRLSAHTDGISDVAFTPDGRWLLSTSFDRTLRRWPLSARVAERGESLHVSWSPLELVKIAPSGERLALGASSFGPVVSRLSGGEPLSLEGLKFQPWTIAWDERGRWVASGGGHAQPADSLIHLWDLETSEPQSAEADGQRYSYIEPTKTLDAGDGEPVFAVVFLSASEVVSGSRAGLRRWSVEQGTFEQLAEGSVMRLVLAPDQNTLLVRRGDTGLGGGPLFVRDLAEGTSREISSHGPSVVSVALGPAGDVLATGDEQGIVRVGRLDGTEPHLLLGHTGSVQALAFSPDGQWIASGSSDKSIRLWPIPELSRPPLHTLVHEELLAKLRSLTNLRAVDDPESETGWSIEIGPFPGWQEVPTW